jgi:pimeloyl-ACP methyl ester carboxylesterase
MAYDLELPGDRSIARRSLLLVPRHLSAEAELPLLVLLHGLGETGNPELGIRAWAEFYGLSSSYERLRRPPIVRTLAGPRYLSDQKLSALNQDLSARPFVGLALACPVTPNPRRHPSASRALDVYADWIEQELVPAARRHATIARGRHAIGLDGCSLGGYVALEVFLRKPELFGSLGMVQGAIGVGSAANYAERLAGAFARSGAIPLHFETSSEDPFRDANQALAKALERRSVQSELVVEPGPHNQPWLREIGTLNMLLFHDRALGSDLRWRASLQKVSR